MGGLVLGDGLAFADAVYGGSRREGQAADAVAAHAFEDVVGADSVLLEVLIGGVAGDELDVGIGGQVIDHVDGRDGGSEGRVEGGGVQKIGFDETEAGMGEQAGDVLEFAAAKVVDHGDAVAAMEQGGGEIRRPDVGASSAAEGLDRCSPLLR